MTKSGWRRWRIGLGATVVVVVVAAAILTVSRRQSDGAADGGAIAIAFVSDRGGRPAVWLLTGGVARPLPIDRSQEPGRGTTEEDGGTSGSYAPTWEPCGDELAFVRSTGDGLDFAVVVFDLASGESREVYSGRGAVGSLSWSTAEGIAVEVGLPDGTQQIRVLDPDRGGARTLISVDERRYGSLHWRPDDGSLVAARTTAGGEAAIVRIDAASGGQEVIVREGFAPSWSADGSRIVYVVPTENGWRVVTADADGGSRRTLYGSPRLVYAPAFTSDARSVVLEQYDENTPDIVLLDVRTGVVTSLVTQAGFDGAPAVKPPSCPSP